MMALPPFRDLPIRQKLRLLILGAGAVAMAVAGVLMAWFAQGWSQTETQRELHTLAGLIGDSATAALQRNDPAGGTRFVGALRENPGVLAGAIYRESGGTFAEYRRGQGEPLPTAPLSAEGFHPGRLELVRAIRTASGERVGAVYLRGDAAGQRRFVVNCVGVVVGGVLLASLVALALSARFERLIAQPITGLVRTAEQVRREENFGLRAPAAGRDELGQLVNAFNDMLTQIQLRDVELRRHRDHLGELIAQRTAELMQLNHALFQARDKAEDASRAKSSFLANMSHELRTPLTAIIGYSEMLIEEAEALNQSESVPDFQRIRDSGRHLLTLINDVLDLSKIEAGKMTLHLENFDLVALAREVFDTMRPLAVKNHDRLELDAPPAGLPVRADHTKVRQTLLNLLGNAIKFTERGEVRLRLATETRDGHPWVVIAVSDTGIGMSEAEIGRLFQAFAQADTAVVRKFGGTGLGLTISRKFTEVMGGTLSVTSQPQTGSTFTVSLPARPLPAPAPVEAAAPAAPAPASASTAPTVLVIDDDPNTRDLMVRFLLKEGFSPHTAADGRHGLQLARQLRPALITLDVMMPEVDGWSVLGALKNDPALAAIPVITVTLTEERDRGFTLGAAEFLTKPVDFGRLSSLLREYCPSPDDRPILVVEDDEISRHLLRRNLEKEGYPVALAANGREALDVIRLRLPAVILLDLMMPEMDGFAFVQAVRERRDMKGVPIIVLTAKDLTEEDRRRLTGGVAVILQKQTLAPEDLQRELRAALAAHLPAVNVQPPAAPGGR